jgi:MoaA/NifB/PqqE/SkfB family radical SAM enzyme
MPIKFRNKSFCLAPWTHLHVLPTGEAKPCCFWSQEHISDDFGNINDYDTVKDLMNHDGFKDLRKKFLKGEKHPGCEKCYNHEDNGRMNTSGRFYFEKFNSAKTTQSIESTQDDGTADSNIVYLDIRFGNICNLKCRMCGYGLSSSWHDEVVKTHELDNVKRMYADTLRGGPGSRYYLDTDNPIMQVNQPKFIHTDSYDKIEPYLQFAEEIYFAGGEPMLYPEHTLILDKLIENGNTDCILRYNTNLSTLKHKGRDIIDLWSKFQNVAVGASIDAMQEGVEFIRSNLKWSVFEKNYNRIKSEAPNINLHPAPTIGILNVEIYPKFSRYCIENNWTNKLSVPPNFIHHPEEQNVKILPQWYKDRICLIYEQHIEWIEERMQDSTIEYSGENAIGGLKEIIGYIKEDINDRDTNLSHLDKLWETLWTWKIVSPELNWTTQLPELYDFFMEFRTRERGFKSWSSEAWEKQDESLLKFSKLVEK